MIAAPDCSFIIRSGRHTYGLGRFYNGSRAESEKVLEISEIAVVDVIYNTAYSVPTWQTPDTLTAGHTRTGTLNILYRMLRVCLCRYAIRLLTILCRK